MAGGLKNFSIAFALTALFIFGLIMFMTTYLQANNPTSSILTNSSISGLQVTTNETLQSWSRLSNASSTILANDNTPTPIYLFLIFEAAFTIPKLFLSVIMTSVHLMGDAIFAGLLGGGLSNQYYIVINIFIAVLIIIAVFYIIRMIRTGDER